MSRQDAAAIAALAVIVAALSWALAYLTVYSDFGTLP